jgi:hypothetical protein
LSPQYPVLSISPPTGNQPPIHEPVGDISCSNHNLKIFPFKFFCLGKIAVTPCLEHCLHFILEGSVKHPWKLPKARLSSVWLATLESLVWMITIDSFAESCLALHLLTCVSSGQIV